MSLRYCRDNVSRITARLLTQTSGSSSTIWTCTSIISQLSACADRFSGGSDAMPRLIQSNASVRSLRPAASSANSPYRVVGSILPFTKRDGRLSISRATRFSDAANSPLARPRVKGQNAVIVELVDGNHRQSRQRQEVDVDRYWDRWQART